MVAPLSVLYSFVSLLVRLPFQPPCILQGWLALEAIFYLAAYLPYKRYLQRAARHPIPPCRDDRRKLFRRCHSNIPDPVLYLRKWFRDAPEEEIKLENVKEFFRWAFLNTGQHDPAYDEEVEEYIEEMERLLGRKFEPGRGDAKCLRLTLDKVEMSHRSLTWYLIWRKPSLANEYLLSYFGSKDIGVSHTLFRRFFWADNMLWKEDIQDRPATVVLAGKDIVVDTKSIRAYLTGSDNWALGTGNRMEGTRERNELEVLWFPNLDHGQVFDERSTRNRLVEIVRGLCKENIN
ncbi:hypothetical protein S40285_00133 [Stachybotrys chlorohalonatus IBT 40285]|uniref:Uncharacterized protein n=1 Tax=Stachybotrys chlorohalonatus (strain IBT 40285) TaxID=1283841 RepID=A0A084QZ39_STAC4|nr:hypothetical protein S40285_00133 [Stachybotrys chlorohalonata IBT 40285]